MGRGNLDKAAGKVPAVKGREATKMNKIIDGKMCNTDTAILLAEAESHEGRSSFGWWQESLYRTKAGRYFLQGEGHANSSWATPCGNSRGPGSGIRVLSEGDAREWVERYSNERYEAIFGAAEEA